MMKRASEEWKERKSTRPCREESRQCDMIYAPSKKTKDAEEVRKGKKDIELGLRRDQNFCTLLQYTVNSVKCVARLPSHSLPLKRDQHVDKDIHHRILRRILKCCFYRSPTGYFLNDIELLMLPNLVE